MIHALLALAVILFLIWIFFHAAGAIINLIWIGIVVLIALWVIGLFRRGASTL